MRRPTANTLLRLRLHLLSLAVAVPLSVLRAAHNRRVHALNMDVAALFSLQRKHVDKYAQNKLHVAAPFNFLPT